MRLFSLCLIALTLSACATPVHIMPVATGGSKSDGTVQLSYSFGGLQKPIIDWESADALAVDHCKKWGYSNAEKFSGQQTQCLSWNSYGCLQHQVLTTYQCLD